MTSPTDPTDPTAELRAGLGRVLAGVWHTDAVEVRDLTRLSGGASRQTWSFTASRTGAGSEKLVLQRSSATAVQSPPRGREASLLREAARQGVPVAEVVAASVDGVGVLDATAGTASSGGSGGSGTPDVEEGDWVLARHVAGETLGPRIARDDEFESARQVLTQQCGAALAAIHRMRTGDTPGLAKLHPPDHYRAVLDTLAQPHPVFELALRWLDEHPPPERPPTLVHGDFRLGNLIVASDGLRAVLDWELPHLGNPVEDLGWLCVRAWRFGGSRPVAGVGTREELLASYEAAGGAAVSLDELRWWEVSGTLAWGVICIAQAERHRSGGDRSVELAAIGRRVCENEWDLCRLLRPELSARIHEAPAAPAVAFPNLPHDVPTVPELLEAVQEYLGHTARPALSGRPAFHARVAANVVATVRRQWELGSGHAAAHAQRLRELGFSNDVDLAAAIRAGSVAADDETLWEAVTTAAHDKLLVANPPYADRP